MRYCVTAFAVAIAVLPAVGQQSAPAPGNAGTVNEQAVLDAVLKAFALPKMAPVVNLRPVQPPRKILVSLPPVMCAVPLTEVPVPRDLDRGILRPESAVSRDPKMPLALGVPSCADIQNR
jgi:hypothetical protein